MIGRIRPRLIQTSVHSCDADTFAAVGTLRAFTRAVDAQAGRRISNENADSLLSQTVVYFEFDKSVVLPEYQGIVAAHASYAASSSSARYTLEGHADERGSREYNLGLGERRGNAVNGLLAAGGASGSQSDVVSYGEERPTCRESSESCWQKNTELSGLRFHCR